MNTMYDQFTAAVRNRDEDTAAWLLERLDADDALVGFLRDEGAPLLRSSDALHVGYVWYPAESRAVDIRFDWYGVALCTIDLEVACAVAHRYIAEKVEESLLIWEADARERGASPDVVEAARTRAAGFGLRAEQRRALATGEPAARLTNLASARREAAQDDTARAVFGSGRFALVHDPKFRAALADEVGLFTV